LEALGGHRLHDRRASADEKAALRVLAGRLFSPLSPPSWLGELSPLDPAAGEEDGAEPMHRRPSSRPGSRARGRRRGGEKLKQR